MQVVTATHRLKPIAADKVMVTNHTNIIKGVVKELIDSDVVLAVLTDYNPNVWYELAIRHASRKGRVLMIEKGQKLPLDISQYGGHRI